MKCHVILYIWYQLLQFTVLNWPTSPKCTQLHPSKMSLSVQLQCVSCLPVLLIQPSAQSPIGATGFQAPPRGPCAELHLFHDIWHLEKHNELHREQTQLCQANHFFYLLLLLSEGIWARYSLRLYKRHKWSAERIYWYHLIHLVLKT